MIDQKQILKNLGFSEFKKFQLECLNTFKQDKNIRLLAPTGTGKTAAYLLSLFNKFKKDQSGTQGLIIVPTRELALQVEQVVKDMKVGIKTTLCYGGHEFRVEKNNLAEEPTLIIATPGRLLDHLNRESWQPNKPLWLVLDEFDKILEIGFEKDLSQIVKEIEIRNTLLVSATNNDNIPKFLGFSPYETIEVKPEKKAAVKQYYVEYEAESKIEALERVLDQFTAEDSVIIFANHREACDRIYDHMEGLGMRCNLFHGGLDQKVRELSLLTFRNKTCSFLLATDLAARGIDVNELTAIIHYQLPDKEASYIHRNGRTGRMGASGKIIHMKEQGSNDFEYCDFKNMAEFYINEEAYYQNPDTTTIKLNKGKKNKVNKIDIVGFLNSFDFMSNHMIGKIDVYDFYSIVVVPENLVGKLIKSSFKKRIKKQSVVIREVF